MKTIMLLLLVFVFTHTNAQTIDTEIKTSRAARCVPFKLNPLLDVISVTHVGLTNMYGNYTNSSYPSIRIDYVFTNDTALIISSGSLTLVGADYLAWFNTVDKIYYFFGYIRTHILDNTGAIFITYQ